MFKLPTELNPEVNFNWVFITVIYPGAAPHDTESLIVDPIEAEVKDIEDIDEIQSNAGEGFGFVMVKFEDMSDDEFREHYLDLKAEIERVTHTQFNGVEVHRRMQSLCQLIILQVRILVSPGIEMKV